MLPDDGRTHLLFGPIKPTGRLMGLCPSRRPTLLRLQLLAPDIGDRHHAVRARRPDGLDAAHAIRPVGVRKRKVSVACSAARPAPEDVSLPSLVLLSSRPASDRTLHDRVLALDLHRTPPSLSLPGAAGRWCRRAVVEMGHGRAGRVAARRAVRALRHRGPHRGGIPLPTSDRTEVGRRYAGGSDRALAAFERTRPFRGYRDPGIAKVPSSAAGHQ